MYLRTRCAVALAVMGAVTAAHALTINMNGLSTVDETPWKRCGHDANDKCKVKAFVSTTVKDSSSPTFSGAWNNWRAANPGWTLVNGGALNGEIKMQTFKAYNDCPGNGGVEIKFDFIPGRNDPPNLKFAQGLLAPRTQSPHAGPVTASSLYMDCNIPPPRRRENPPLYPFSYADGHFYDKPGRTCVENATVSWFATCLFASANFRTKKLTTYQGISYGFDFTCVPNAVPEPASMVSLGIGVMAIVRLRKARSNKAS